MNKSPRNFISLLRKRWELGNFVCVGLDSDYEKLPKHIKTKNIPSSLFNFNKQIIDATNDTVCAFKPNSAFYEAYPGGPEALKDTIDYIHQNYPDIPVILDAKRADIGSTNQGYVKWAFDYLRADAITIHPYLGQEALSPFLEKRDKGIIVLARTSNSGAGEFQDLKVNGKEPLYLAVARNVSKKWNKNGNCLLVAGATFPKELKQVRKVVGDLPLLIPGIGKQGGDLKETVLAGMDSRGQGMIINSSSSVIFASSGRNFADKARQEALRLRNEINQYIALNKSLHPEGLTSNQEKLARLLFDTKTIAPVRRRKRLPAGKFEFYKVDRPTSPLDFSKSDEEFALKLHEKTPGAPLSPVYVNLRNLPEELLRQVGIVMAEMPTHEIPDVCSGIPKAGLPLADAYSKHSGIKAIGIFSKEENNKSRKITAISKIKNRGLKLRIIDDMATKGETKLESVKAAEQMGFRVTDILIIVDRQQGAMDFMAKEGYRLQAAFTLGQLLKFGLRTKRITKVKYEKVKKYLKN